MMYIKALYLCTGLLHFVTVKTKKDELILDTDYY